MALSLCRPFVLLLFVPLLLLPPPLVGAVPLMDSELVHLLREHPSAQQNVQQRIKMGEANGSKAGEKGKTLSEMHHPIPSLSVLVPSEDNAPQPSPTTTTTTTTTTPSASSSQSASSSSNSSSDASARLLCQFFIFSTLFGSVCTISACTCLFRTRRSFVSSSQRRRVASVEDSSISRLTRIREPFGPDKPFCLKFDEKGLCYASPLTREVPPLPTYEDACKMLSLAELVANCSESKEKREYAKSNGDHLANEKV